MARRRTNACGRSRRARTAATLDTKETVVGTTLLFPCFIDGCGLFAGDVHFAMGGGEVAGTAIEMGAKVRLQAKVIPGGASRLSTMHFEGGAQLKQLAPSSFYAVSGLPLKPEGEVPVFSTYLGGQKIAPLANLSEDLTLAARNATLNMIDFLVKTKGLTREQAYVLTSVAVDLNISQVVDVPNVGVTAILNRDVFKEQSEGMKRRALLTFGAGAAAFGLAGHRSIVMAADEHKWPRRALLADLEPDGCGRSIGAIAL